MDKHDEEDEEDSDVGEHSSGTETNGTEKLSLLKQMLLAGIDKRQRQDGIRRTHASVIQKVEGVTHKKGNVNEKAEGIELNIECASTNIGGGKQNTDGVNQKSEGVKMKIEVGSTTSQTTPCNQHKKRKKPKSGNEESQKKEKKKRETKDEDEEEPPAKKTQKVAKEKVEEESPAKKTQKVAKEKVEEEPATKKTQKVAKERDEEESEESDSDDASEEIQYSPLTLCLETLHRNLQRKDVQGVFSFPVTDSLAPGYFDVVKTPMDFLTMSRKISEQKYTSLGEFREDFLLMCGNAMLYHKSGSIQHESAEKLLTAGLKMFSNENLSKLNESIGVTDFHSQNTHFTVDKTFNTKTLKHEATLHSNRSSPRPLQRTKEERQTLLTVSLLTAARKARGTLMKKQSNQLQSGCLTENISGKPALNILNPDTLADDVPERHTIGYTGRRRRVHRRKQERSDDTKDNKNNVIPVNYLLYGPYGSFGPNYDSSLSNLTKDESDMLIHTYASQGHKDYMTDVTTYDDDDYVDRILNALGRDDLEKPVLDGQLQEGIQTKRQSDDMLHKTDQFKDTTQVEIQPERGLEIGHSEGNANVKSQTIDDNTEASNKRDVKNDIANLDLTSLLTLDRVGIDVSFLNDMLKPSRFGDMNNEKNTDSLEDELKSKLSQNAELLHALKQSQYDRFTTGGEGAIDIPSIEIKTASSITDNLKELIGMVQPKDVVSSEGVRKAIGVGKKVT